MHSEPVETHVSCSIFVFSIFEKWKNKNYKIRIQAFCPTEFRRVYIPTYPTQVYIREKPAETVGTDKSNDFDHFAK